MSDLNDWRLAYGAETLDFGHSTSGYPFQTQVSISDIDRETQDNAHPTSDGVLMGRDRLRGFVLQFDCMILTEYPITAKPWMSALDLYSEFAAKWRANPVRLTPGKYATMANLDRQRLVYGRPRGIAPKTNMLRKGIVNFIADFATNSPDFYDTLEKVALISPVPSSTSKLNSPLTSPITTITDVVEIAPTINDGDLPAWPVVEFHGPGSAASLELLSGTTVLWKINVPDRVRYDEVLTVDTRPWNRSATINGRPANGRIRGSQLEKCSIPVGSFDLRYRVKDESGTAYAVVRWRDTYASL